MPEQLQGSSSETSQLNKTIPGPSYIAFFEFSATCNQILQYGCKNEPASITGVHPVPCRDNFLRSHVPTYGIVVACICFFVPAFAVPSEIRSAEQSIALSVNMFFAFSIAQVFLPTLSLMKCGLFIFFASFVAIMTSFIPFLPERKDVSIQEMYKVLERTFVLEEIHVCR
ncbi:hypothetical protein NC653_038628 [Populus alba x Populus x berolinensis]|uniref:Uncharacterized protein n=1 Tax=Populus alba x Populus x berolinensis TaxID=444605 RepID=A0AAD6LIP5_9ROSI|nr:hypothetical protein NC653_038628 [Populus alba x Populus x berolinensis]